MLHPQRRDRHLDRAEQLTRLQDVLLHAGDELLHRYAALAAVWAPDHANPRSAVVSEIMAPR